jgi:hypothetical protein
VHDLVEGVQIRQARLDLAHPALEIVADRAAGGEIVLDLLLQLDREVLAGFGHAADRVHRIVQVAANPLELLRDFGDLPLGGAGHQRQARGDRGKGQRNDHQRDRRGRANPSGHRRLHPEKIIRSA